MGYYTEYEAEDIGREKFEGSVQDAIAEFIGCDPFEDRCKWYDHDLDMLRFSREFPHIAFKLTGVGEESPDIWAKYYQNGKMQATRATISFSLFDPSKLVDMDPLPPRY